MPFITCACASMARQQQARKRTIYEIRLTGSRARVLMVNVKRATRVSVFM